MKSRAPHSHIDQQPPGLRHLFVADNRLYVDRTIMSMLKHERVECAIAHDDHNNEETLFDFSSPDYPIERLFSNTVRGLISLRSWSQSFSRARHASATETTRIFFTKWLICLLRDGIRMARLCSPSKSMALRLESLMSIRL